LADGLGDAFSRGLRRFGIDGVGEVHQLEAPSFRRRGGELARDVVGQTIARDDAFHHHRRSSAVGIGMVAASAQHLGDFRDAILAREKIEVLHAQQDEADEPQKGPQTRRKAEHSEEEIGNGGEQAGPGRHGDKEEFGQH